MIGVLQKHKSFETVQVKTENTISLPGLTIYPNQRKMYRDRQEIPLTTKEYELLCLFATNQGQVLTYTQIYEKVWGSSPAGNERIIRFHICNFFSIFLYLFPNCESVQAQDFLLPFPDSLRIFYSDKNRKVRKSGG